MAEATGVVSEPILPKWPAQAFRDWYNTAMFIQRWINRLLQLYSNSNRKRPAQWPTKEQIANLPPFDALKIDDVIKVNTPEAARQAVQEISIETVVGFDTESKPTFKKGEVSTGPHTVQFSSMRRAYVFQLHEPECRKAAGELIAKNELMKVGFGLGDDLRRIHSKLKVEPQNVRDLEAQIAAKASLPA